MTLVESIEESMRLGDSYSKSGKLADILADAKVLLKQIQEANSEIYSALQDCAAMVKAGLLDKKANAEIQRILESILASVLEGEYQTDGVTTLLRECQVLGNGIHDSWKTYIRKEIGTQKDILIVLKALIDDTQQYLILKNTYDSIVSYASPGSEEMLAKIKKYKEASNKLIQSLGLEDSVMLFFKKLAAEEVLPLSALTQDVWKWITENNYENKFTIKISDR